MMTFERGPLLRLGLEANRGGNEDCLWATTRTSLNPQKSIVYPLEARPTDFFDIEIRVLTAYSIGMLIDGQYPNQMLNNLT
eukprot:scaffold46967_cov52-Attheya_sp.AAC.2